MWKVPGPACGLLTISVLVLIAAPASADSSGYYNNNSQFGMVLPYASLPSGQDEIRTADGTSCRSAVGGDGTYMDTGVIGTPATQNLDSSAAVYGRLVIPLGKKATRLDCTRLYDLEIERLRTELALAKMGLSGDAAAQAPSAAGKNWENEGWTNVTPTAASAAPIDPPLKANAAKKITAPAIIVSNSIY
jgi:hypothetical protein